MKVAACTKSFVLRAMLALACFGFSGCLDEDEDENECEPTPLLCNRYVPSSASLTVRVGGGNLQVVKVYRGSFYETGALVWTGYSGTTLRLPLGDYSATATYAVDGKTVIAMDGDVLDYTSAEYCSGTCYEEEDGLVDLALE